MRHCIENEASMTVEEVVRGFLKLVLQHPEKPPRTQRAERDNQMVILGFTRAQETLRTLLKVYGLTEAVRELSDVRDNRQERPIDGPGGTKVWVAS